MTILVPQSHHCGSAFSYSNFLTLDTPTLGPQDLGTMWLSQSIWDGTAGSYAGEKLGIGYASNIQTSGPRDLVYIGWRGARIGSQQRAPSEITFVLV